MGKEEEEQSDVQYVSVIIAAEDCMANAVLDAIQPEDEAVECSGGASGGCAGHGEHTDPRHATESLVEG